MTEESEDFKLFLVEQNIENNLRKSCKTMRLEKNWSYADVAKLAGMKESDIQYLEDEIDVFFNFDVIDALEKIDKILKNHGK